ncbi:MAG: fimbria/pilus outer membrane usher protein [Citrobacter braakii]
MKKGMVLFLIIFHLVQKYALAEEFNYSFIRGGSKQIPEILNNIDKNASGKYFVDIIFNKSKVAASVELNINEKDSEYICLSEEWLENSGIHINKEFYKTFFNASQECYYIGKEKNSQVKLGSFLAGVINRYASGWLYRFKKGRRHLGLWQYRFQTRYDLNTSKSTDQDRTTYGNIEGQINIGEWVLLGRGYAYQGEKFESNNLLLTHAIKSIKSDILIGKTQSYNTLNDGFTFYGAQLKSNQDMYPWDSQSYAPVINGIARTHARVTVEQGGYTLKSFVVPPGPFVINDLTGVYSGDIILKIYEEDGSVKEQRFPVAVLAKFIKTRKL